jgi:release factor glutamine methyltransferase
VRYSELVATSLKKFKNQDKALDLQLLLEAAFHLTREQSWIKRNDEIADRNALKRFYRYRERLIKDEPVAYILKKKEFYGVTFFINRGVLIPRPETEILVEQAIASIKKPLEILDIGAGSGVISILLAQQTGSAVTAVEKSRRAFAVLEKNIALQRMSGKVKPVCCDLFPGVGGFDMIVSNPPYVPEAEWWELAPKVRDYEPREALVAGTDGLDIIRRIVAGAPAFLCPGGILLMEIGYNQHERVREILQKSPFARVEFYRDYSHIPRVVLAQLHLRREAQK